jgi:hypothetical protein
MTNQNELQWAGALAEPEAAARAPIAGYLVNASSEFAAGPLPASLTK